MKKIFLLFALSVTGYAMSGGTGYDRLKALARSGTATDWRNYKNEILSALRSGNITLAENDWRMLDRISSQVTAEIRARDPHGMRETDPLKVALLDWPGALLEQINKNLGDVFKVHLRERDLTKSVIDLTPDEIATHKKAIKEILSGMRKQEVHTRLLNAIAELRSLELLINRESRPMFESGMSLVETIRLRENLEAIAKALGIKIPVYSAPAASSAASSASLAASAAAAAATPVASTAIPAPLEFPKGA